MTVLFVLVACGDELKTVTTHEPYASNMLQESLAQG